MLIGIVEQQMRQYFILKLNSLFTLNRISVYCLKFLLIDIDKKANKLIIVNCYLKGLCKVKQKAIDSIRIHIYDISEMKQNKT